MDKSASLVHKYVGVEIRTVLRLAFLDEVLISGEKGAVVSIWVMDATLLFNGGIVIAYLHRSLQQSFALQLLHIFQKRAPALAFVPTVIKEKHLRELHGGRTLGQLLHKVHEELLGRHRPGGIHNQRQGDGRLQPPHLRGPRRAGPYAMKAAHERGNVLFRYVYMDECRIPIAVHAIGCQPVAHMLVGDASLKLLVAHRLAHSQSDHAHRSKLDTTLVCQAGSWHVTLHLSVNA
mmetsp:Transcript_85349/g.241619  ORF Transcript_85349/g.241619 Transcript_85349/m.241619 type:complete len:234 (-) Transcript_85349:748-1449(-)